MAAKSASAGLPNNLEEVFTFYGLDIREIHGLLDFGLVDSGDSRVTMAGGNFGDLMIHCDESEGEGINTHLKLLKNFKGVYSPKGQKQEKYYCFSPIQIQLPPQPHNCSPIAAYQMRRLLAETKKIPTRKLSPSSESRKLAS